jgi:sporulation protein YlmC with PRC-barrel domain
VIECDEFASQRRGRIFRWVLPPIPQAQHSRSRRKTDGTTSTKRPRGRARPTQPHKPMTATEIPNRPSEPAQVVKGSPCWLSTGCGVSRSLSVRSLGAPRPKGAGILRLSELLNREIVSESGRQLGHVHDVRGELVEGHLRVIGLVAGKLGILERYGVGTHGSGGPGQAKVHGHPVIPWERVVRIGAKVVVHD